MAQNPASGGAAWLKGGRGSLKTTRKRNRKHWRPGHDRSATCPTDPAHRKVRRRRQWGACQGDRLKKLHSDREDIIRLDRRAGYYARYNWSIEQVEAGKNADGSIEWETRYTDGPAAGCVFVDPWKSARGLGACGAHWYGDLRSRGDGQGGLEILSVPRPINCDRRGCPVCDARRSAKYAAALRRDLMVRVAKASRNNEPAVGHLALMTLTQRKKPGESYREASQRIKRAFRKLTSAYTGQSWRYWMRGWFWGMEAVERLVAKVSEWHVHLHVVVEVRSDRDPAAARAWIGQQWQRITEEIAPGWGWAPEAGGCIVTDNRMVNIGNLVDTDSRHLNHVEMDRPRSMWNRATSHPAYDYVEGKRSPRKVRRYEKRAELVNGEMVTRKRRVHLHDVVVSDWSGAWWQEIDPTDPKQVYQACKYPCAFSNMSPIGRAEWLSAARGQQYHGGGGAWVSVLSTGEKLLDEEADLLLEMAHPDDIKPDIGERICDLGGHRPELDDSEADFFVWSLIPRTLAEVPAAMVKAIEEQGGWVEVDPSPPIPRVERKPLDKDAIEAELEEWGLPVGADLNTNQSLNRARLYIEIREEHRERVEADYQQRLQAAIDRAPTLRAVLPRRWAEDSAEMVTEMYAAWFRRQSESQHSQGDNDERRWDVEVTLVESQRL